jgi:hypothetical protein
MVRAHDEMIWVLKRIVSILTDEYEYEYRDAEYEYE